MNQIIYPSWIEKVNNLDDFGKSRIYMRYVCAQLSLLHNSEVIDKTKPDWNRNRSKPDRETETLAFYNHWRDTKISSFNDFCSNSNVQVIDHGEKWKENGFAQQYRVCLSGIYDWYGKIEHTL